MKVVRSSALHPGRLYLPGNIPGTHSCYMLSRPWGHNVAGRIKSIKNSYDTIANRTHGLPTCSAVPQPTAPPRGPTICVTDSIVSHFSLIKNSKCLRKQLRRIFGPSGGTKRGMRKINIEEPRNFLIFIRLLFAWSDRPEWNCGPYSSSVKEEKHGERYVLV